MNNLINDWTYEGTTYTITWLPDIDINSISPVTQSYGFCYNDENELLVVETLTSGKWQVPGGHLEASETAVDTLHREIIEEADVKIKDIIYLGAQKITNNQDDKFEYQVRYAARVEAVLPRTPDPDKGFIIPRKFVDPYTYNQLADWGVIGDELIRLSMEKIGITE